MKQLATRNSRQWSGPSGYHAARPVRCACRQCGSHVFAVANRQTLGGMCGVCGSYEIEPLETSGPQLGAAGS